MEEDIGKSPVTGLEELLNKDFLDFFKALERMDGVGTEERIARIIYCELTPLLEALDEACAPIFSDSFKNWTDTLFAHGEENKKTKEYSKYVFKVEGTKSK
ncbi:MAG: hypothetical protein V3T58_08230 [Candidatus Hydrothermarchaeales archaeon]